MTVSHAWSLLISLPAAARVAVAVLCAAVPLGVWQISKTAAAVLVALAAAAGSLVHPLVERSKPKTAPAPSRPLLSGPIPVRPEVPGWLRDEVIEVWLHAWSNGEPAPKDSHTGER